MDQYWFGRSFQDRDEASRLFDGEAPFGRHPEVNVKDTEMASRRHLLAVPVGCGVFSAQADDAADAVTPLVFKLLTKLNCGHLGKRKLRRRGKLRAIAGHCRRNRRVSGDERTECGAEFTAIRADWTLAFRCGDYRFIVAEKGLVEAERSARDREMGLAARYVPNLPACARPHRDPKGEIKPRELEVSRRSR